MKFKLVGGSLSALLLAAALAGCTGGGNNAGGSSGGTTLGSTSGNDVLATVGTVNVTREQLDQSLEGLYGDRYLPQVIDTELLAQELKSKNITLTDDEINKEQARVSAQDPTVKAALDLGGARVYVIRNQVVRNLSLQKLAIDGIKGDPTKEKAFYNTFAAYYGTPTQNKVGILAASTKVRADQLARSLKDKPDSFDALVAEQKSKVATDQIAGFSKSSADAQFAAPDDFISVSGFPAQVAPQLAPLLASSIKALATAKKGDVLPRVALSPNGPFLILKVLDHKEAVKPSYDQVKAQVETDYKLSQPAFAEIKKNPGNPAKLEDNVKSVIRFLGQANPDTGTPGIKAEVVDALMYILRPSFSTTIQKLHDAGTVQISDPAFKEVAKQYQQPTAVPGAAGGNSAADNSAAGNTAAANAATTNMAATNTATTNSAAPSTP